MNSNRPSCFVALFVCFCILFVGIGNTAARSGNNSFEKPSEGKMINGFRMISEYLNDADKPMGGRYIHSRTGFTLDLLQLQSVPQGFIWVNSFPTSDKGEPHTQE